MKVIKIEIVRTTNYINLLVVLTFKPNLYQLKFPVTRLMIPLWNSYLFHVAHTADNRERGPEFCGTV